MPTIGTLVTLADLARRSDSSGKITSIVELLNLTNEILDDMHFVEGNLPVGHLTTVRTGLPSATWRLLNYGVQPSKSTTKQVVDTCGMLEAYAEVDKKLADLNGNTAEFRLSEDRAFLEAMNKEMATTLFYGDTSVNPEKFVGLKPRYTTLSSAGDKTLTSFNVVDGGSAKTATSQTSIWVVVWGPNTVHGIVPKGTTAGFQHQDLGEVTLLDGASGKFQGYRTHYKWDIGLAVRDWRYAVRIANIEPLNATASVATVGDITKSLVKAFNKIPSMSMGTPVIYCNQEVLTILEIHVADKTNTYLTWQQGADRGAKVLSFRGVPIRRCDALLNTEAVVS
jgi:hypothetical protein